MSQVDATYFAGVKGDGSNDDTAGLIGAVNAATTIGAELYLPSGTYLVSDQGSGVCWSVNATNIVIRFSPGATLKLKSGAPATVMMFLGDPTGTVQRSGIRVYGAKIDLNGNTDTKGIRAGWTKDMVVAGCEVLNGVGVNGAQAISISGKDSASRATDILVADCYIHDITGGLASDAIICNNTSRVEIRNNRVSNTGRAVFLTGSNRACIVQGNTGSSNSDNGIRVTPAAAISDNIGHVIQGNTIDGAAVDGIRLNGTHLTCVGNVVLNVTQAGIKADLCQDSIIEGNQVDSCGTDGIALMVAGLTELGGPHRGVRILGNSVTNCGNFGIRSLGGGFSGSDPAVDILIADNFVFQNNGGGVDVEDTHDFIVARNNVRDNAVSAGNKSGIYVNVSKALNLSHGGLIHSNRSYDSRGAGTPRQFNGLLVDATNASGTLAGILVEDNDCSDSPNYGIRINPAPVGTISTVLVRRNTVANCPSAGVSARATDTGSDNRALRTLGDVSGDRGNASVTLSVGSDEPVQRFATTLTANRTCTLSTAATTSKIKGNTFRIVRTAGGAFNLTVQDDTPTTTKVLNGANQWVDVTWNGSAWIETAFGNL